MLAEKTTSKALPVGLAMFSIFFGAGNTIYPIILGMQSQDKNLFGFLGFFLMAVIVPFLGLITVTLFQGKYKDFFFRVGVIPGSFIIYVIMMLIGPFAGIPRTITLSYSTLQIYLPQIPFLPFIIIACLVIFLMTFKKNNILTWLGYILTPLLILSLAIVIGMGFYFAEDQIPHTFQTKTQIFINGLELGYQTMDLLAALFFSGVVIACLHTYYIEKNNVTYHKIRSKKRVMMQATVLAAVILTLIYLSLSLVGAFYSNHLNDLDKDKLLGFIALKTLGFRFGIISSICVALACITTAIALTAIFAQFIKNEIFRMKVSDNVAIVITLIITFLMSLLGFEAIVDLLGPILVVVYPVLIALTVVNFMHKVWGFQPVRLIFWAVFIASLIINAY